MSFYISTLDKIIEDQEHGLYDFTENGKCSSCGKCCGNYIPLSKKDINRIKKFIKINNIKEVKRVFNFLNNVPIDSMCPFLDHTKENNKCTIYAVRPEICKAFNCSSWKNMSNVLENYLEFGTNKYIPMNVRETFFGNK